MIGIPISNSVAAIVGLSALCFTIGSLLVVGVLFVMEDRKQDREYKKFMKEMDELNKWIKEINEDAD